MKTYVRNGCSFNVTEALYKKLKQINLFEDMPNNANPASAQQPSPANPATNNNGQQEANNKNAIPMDELTRRIENLFIFKLKKDNIMVDSDENAKSELKNYMMHLSDEDKLRFLRDNNYIQAKYNELLQVINRKSSSAGKEGKISELVRVMVNKIYNQLDVVLKNYNKEVTEEINNKLNKNYETIDIASFVMSGLPDIDTLVTEITPKVIKKFNNKNLKEAEDGEYYDILDSQGRKIKKPEKVVEPQPNTDMQDDSDEFVYKEGIHNILVKYVKDTIFEILEKKLNDKNFKNNTARQSKELGDEWVSNMISKLINVVKFGIYGNASGERANYGSIDIHNYTESQVDELWSKLKENVNSMKPSNELEELFKIAITKMINLVDEDYSKRNNDGLDAKNKSNNGEEEKNKTKLENTEQHKEKLLVFQIYNDYSRALSVSKNFTSTMKVNKNFVKEILEDKDLMNKIEKMLNNIGSKGDVRLINRVADFIFDNILQNYVFKDSVTSDPEYDADKYSVDSKKKVKEVVSINNGYKVIFLTEKKRIDDDVENTGNYKGVEKIISEQKIKDITLLLDLMKQYEIMVYNKFKSLYNDIEKIGNDNGNLEEAIEEVYDTIMSLNVKNRKKDDADVEGYLPLMIFGIVKKVTIVISNYAVKNIDNYVEEKMKKDKKDTDNVSVLKKRALENFEMYMGRKPLQSDVQHYKKILEQLKSQISQMSDIDEAFISSAAKRYFYKVTDYFIKSLKNKKNLDIDLLSAITSLKRGKGNESEQFLNSCVAFAELGEYYKKAQLKNKKRNDYFDDLVIKMFENNEIISNEMINSLFHEVWITNNNLSSAQLITIFTKNPALKSKYEFNQDYDITALYSKKPVIILDKESGNFVGVLSFISIHNIINALKQLGNFDINKLKPQFKGRKYT